MKNNKFETLIGTLVIIIAILFLSFASKITNSKQNVAGGYDIVAIFDNIDGINIGSDIKIAGVKVGSVSNIKLNQVVLQ